MDSRDPVVVFFEKSVIQSITLLRKWDFTYWVMKSRILGQQEVFKGEEKDGIYILCAPGKEGRGR